MINKFYYEGKKLEFNEINVLLGPNSCGKTYLLHRLGDENKLAYYASSNFNLAAVRKPSNILITGNYVLGDASNFVNTVFCNRGYHDLYVRTLKEALPELVAIELFAREYQISVELVFENQRVPLSELSDGVLRLIIIAWILITSNKKLIAIEEPELNLHPAWQKLLGKWIQLFCYQYEQCFITTHSPDLLDVFTDGFKQADVGIFVFNSSTGKYTVRKLNYDELASELDEYELGDLYRINDPCIGGWPW